MAERCPSCGCGMPPTRTSTPSRTTSRSATRTARSSPRRAGCRRGRPRPHGGSRRPSPRTPTTPGSRGPATGPPLAPGARRTAFRVDAVVEPPSAPSPLLPAEGALVEERRPMLVVTNAVSPDRLALTYAFELDSLAEDGTPDPGRAGDRDCRDPRHDELDAVDRPGGRPLLVAVPRLGHVPERAVVGDAAFRRARRSRSGGADWTARRRRRRPRAPRLDGQPRAGRPRLSRVPRAPVRRSLRRARGHECTVVRGPRGVERHALLLRRHGARRALGEPALGRGVGPTRSAGRSRGGGAPRSGDAQRRLSRGAPVPEPVPGVAVRHARARARPRSPLDRRRVAPGAGGRRRGRHLPPGWRRRRGRDRRRARAVPRSGSWPPTCRSGRTRSGSSDARAASISPVRRGSTWSRSRRRRG